jgi:hypothetical protein
LQGNLFGGNLQTIKHLQQSNWLNRLSPVDHVIPLRPYGSQGNPFWAKGKSGNPFGRPLGSKNKTHQKYIESALITFVEWMTDKFTFQLDPDSKHPESVQLLLAFAKSDKIQPSLRIVAATAASKHEAQYLYSQVTVPDFANVEEAEAFLLELSRQVAARKIDTRTASTINSHIQNWISNKRADQELELKRIAANQIPGDGIIRIEGGLPTLPLGPNDGPMIMPKFNGHAAIEHVPATDSINGQAPRSESPAPKAQKYYRGQPVQES